MKNETSIVLFGYGKFGQNIAEVLRSDGVDMLLVESDEKRCEKAKKNGFENCVTIDITDDEDLKKLEIKKEDQLVCVMDNDHLNVFLVLSLRALYPENKILVISDSIHATSKLKMAGADKVIDLYAVSANRIHNILNKPVTTKFLEEFMGNSNEYSFYEIVIPENSFLHGKMLDEIDFSRYGVIFVGMIDTELGNSFIFVTTGIEHKLDSGDIIVCIGKEKDLELFEAAVAKPQEEALR